MRHLILKTANSNYFFLTYFATLLLSFNYFFVTYINSSYLSQYISERNVGTLYTVGSFLTIILFFNIARLLKKFGNYRLMTFFLFIELLSLFGMAFFNDLEFIILAFLVHHTIHPMLFVSMDIFVEHYSTNENTGLIRGIFITIISIAAVISSFVVGRIIGDGNFELVYLFSAAFVTILYLVVYSNFRNFRDSAYPLARGIALVQKFLREKNLRKIFVTSVMLNFFYSWIIIYVPIYMYQYLGFSFPEIGLAISISLLPFVLFDIPLGELADKVIGEKEIMVVGYLLMIVALLLIGQTTLSSLPLWTALLFLARTGASFADIANDTYFFKQINETNDELVTIWRINAPVGYVLGTIAGSAALIILPFQFIFFILAVVMLIGLFYAGKIEDTL